MAHAERRGGPAPPGHDLGTGAWALHHEGYDAADEGRREALCTVGNGYIATRGAAPEASADGVHYPGTYAAGVYNRLRSEVAGRVVEEESLVNLPNWLVVDFRIDGGPWFDVDATHLVEYHQELDVRRSLLVRRLRFRDDAGRTTAVSQRRFVDMHLEHACALEVTIVPEDWSGRLEIRSALDGTVANSLVERYRHFAGNHLEPLRSTELSDDAVLLEVVTNQSGIRVAMAARSTLWRDDDPVAARRRLVQREAWIGHDIAVDVGAGQSVTLEKMVTVFTGRDRAISEPGREAARWLPRLGRFEAQLEGHVLAWSRLWAQFHVEMEDRERTVGAMRLHLLHLLQTLSPNTAELDVGVPARGLHGEAYRGHVLWDELFVFPVLNLRLPRLTRSLLGYRHRRLREACHAAERAGHDGAMYPWQSASDGTEQTQQLNLNPASGHWIPDRTPLQRHIGIAVAYDVWQYHQVTADQEYLLHEGAEILIEVARFCASIASYDHALDRYVIRGVMGPDEFHTAYPHAERAGIDNNAYTNVMAVWVLRRAFETMELLADAGGRELQERLGLRPEELVRWEDISRKMFVPFRSHGVMSQFEGYDDLVELDRDGYRERYGNIQRLDLILEAEGDSVNRYKASKQADVLMLFYLLSADELREILEGLGYELGREAIPETIRYYLARTSHGSSLSIVVHAWVLARAHRERALDFFDEALRVDIADIQGGTTPEGIHLAAMAGSVDLLQRCFSGLEMRGDRLILNPYWPEPLGTLTFSIRYRGHTVTLRIQGHGVDVTSGPGKQAPVEVACRGEVATLRPGSTVTFPL